MFIGRSTSWVNYLALGPTDGVNTSLAKYVKIGRYDPSMLNVQPKIRLSDLSHKLHSRFKRFNFENS